MGAVFFLAGMKQKWDESGGRVLLGDNTSGEVKLWPIRFQCDSLYFNLTPFRMHIQSPVRVLSSDQRTIRLAPNRKYALVRCVFVHI
jgi:hypothetical protein